MYIKYEARKFGPNHVYLARYELGPVRFYIGPGRPDTNKRVDSDTKLNTASKLVTVRLLLSWSNLFFALNRTYRTVYLFCPDFSVLNRPARHV